MLIFTIVCFSLNEYFRDMSDGITGEKKYHRSPKTQIKLGLGQVIRTRFHWDRIEGIPPLCVNGKDASQEPTVADPSLLGWRTDSDL